MAIDEKVIMHNNDILNGKSCTIVRQSIQLLSDHRPVEVICAIRYCDSKDNGYDYTSRQCIHNGNDMSPQ